VSEKKVGDVVAWADVPDGALVRDQQGWYAMRLRDRGVYVGTPGNEEPWLSANPWPDEGRWWWGHSDPHQRVPVVALGLTGQESADDLRQLAEVFEVREALRVEPGLPGFQRVYLGDVMVGGFSGGDGLTFWARRLHAAGCRPGMSPEDAARTLAEAGR
jgi:hypothetical protein